MKPEVVFCELLKEIPQPRVLEIGTLQWVEGVSTHHGEWLPSDATHIKTDVGSGGDVDVVSDAHDLKEFSDGEFDALIAVSVWEHLRHPWIAAETCARVLRPGGLLYIATHHTFPVHGYPNDYTRWTDEGLKALFDEPLWCDQIAGFSFPAKIVPPLEVKAWNKEAPSYLNVNITARRTSKF